MTPIVTAIAPCFSFLSGTQPRSGHDRRLKHGYGIEAHAGQVLVADAPLLEDELREYDQLKSGELALPPVKRIEQIAPFIAKIRIAKGISQTELARRLGVSKQVISRYEESDYQTVAIGRLQEILDAIGVKTLVTLSA